MRIFIKYITILCFLFAFSYSKEGFKPFIFAYENTKNIKQNIALVKRKIKKQNINIVAEYAPYKNAYIIIVNTKNLLKIASSTKLGAFGAMIKISITKVGQKIQISYNNPIYLSYIYHLKKLPLGITKKLKKSLGYKREFGTKKTYTKDELLNYHYKIFMPYYNDILQLASYDTYEDGIKVIEKGLSHNKNGVKKVFRIDMPNKKTSIFGVSMSKKSSSDKYIMSEIDFKKLKSTAHLPYEIILINNKAYILHAEFRIAINFPELSMMGKNSFMNIMQAPDNIEYVLKNSINK